MRDKAAKESRRFSAWHKHVRSVWCSLGQTLGLASPQVGTDAWALVRLWFAIRL